MGLHEIGSLILELLEMPAFAYKLPSDIRQDDVALDCNPRTVKKQMNAMQKRNKEKEKRLSSKRQTLTIREPVLGNEHGNGNGHMKRINLSKLTKLDLEIKNDEKKRDRRH